MNNILNYIPGYRSRTKWKMIVASIYYIFSLLTLITGVGNFLFFVAAPFVGFGIIDFIKHRKPRYLVVAIVSFLLMGCGVSLSSDFDQQRQQRLPEPSPTIGVSATPRATATALPTLKPTSIPTPQPTAIPTPIPTSVPTSPPATAVPTQNAAASTDTSSDAEMVWVGETGNKYHHEDCMSLKGKGRQITMKDALAEGRTACGICYR